MIFYKRIGILVSFLLLSLQGYSQIMDYDIISESAIFLKSVYNNQKIDININIDGSSKFKVTPGCTLAIDKTAKKFVKSVTAKESKELWRAVNIVNEPTHLHPAKDKANEEKKIITSLVESKPVAEKSVTDKNPSIKIISVNKIVSIFKETLEKDTFYSSLFVQTFHDEVAKHLDLMNYLMDKESREEYIQKHGLREYYEDKKIAIKRKEDNIDLYINRFIVSNFNSNELPDRFEYETKLRNILEEKISERKDILESLHDNIFNEDVTTIVPKHSFFGNSKIISVGVILLVICLFSFVVQIVRKTNKKKKAVLASAEITKQNAQADIIVRRKTTSILKKQSLEDVQNNEMYLPIECTDFCSDSAVRRIYLKNTCIKDIYNMYAEDLRNPDNPNEDGCMVLGRWVHDEQDDEYYVSLEEIVKPGDDAIFKEYELNFGGKIKLKVSERLRKLRRETNLQYDMTCWVHSHPGLGVFFSNADNGVQMQLKHPTHPKFLVAIVIDILTPNQELGIFTFKHDLSINSKNDLKRMYSLEDLHKWAIESDRTSFKPEDYRNIMQKAAVRISSHYGIELSNGAIIDICQLQASQENSLLVWVHGYAYDKNGKKEYVLTSVSKEKVIPDNDLLGCYISGSHCSIPTIKRIASNNLINMKFILFYSTSEDVLTAIPVIDGQLSMDESCYGEEKLEELKIWTRRKR